MGIYPEEYLPELIPVEPALRPTELVLGICLEGLDVFGTVMVGILGGAVHHVIGDIVGLPEMVSLYHSDVDCVTYHLVAVVLVAVRSGFDLFMCQRDADIEMDIALLLTDAGHNAVHILLRSLDILLRTGNEDFTGLAEVAGFVLV